MEALWPCHTFEFIFLERALLSTSVPPVCFSPVRSMSVPASNPREQKKTVTSSTVHSECFFKKIIVKDLFFSYAWAA